MSRRVSDLTQRLQALVEFHAALAALLEMSAMERDYWNDTLRIRPMEGREREWSAAKAAIDRLAPKAARSFAVAGVFVDWKPRGTFTTYPINPGTHWATILSPDPRFDLGVLEACINQAIGALEDEIGQPRRRSAVWTPRVRVSAIKPVVKWIAAVAAAVAASGIAVWLGWW